MLKVKVGGGSGPKADAARSLELLRGSPKGSTLRLDANQAWTMDEALCFSAALAAQSSIGVLVDASAARMEACPELRSVEYIEEPLRNPRLLGKFWELSGRALPYALDESLGMGREVFTDDVSVASLFVCSLVCSCFEGLTAGFPGDAHPGRCTSTGLFDVFRCRLSTPMYLRCGRGPIFKVQRGRLGLLGDREECSYTHKRRRKLLLLSRLSASWQSDTPIIRCTLSGRELLRGVVSRSHDRKYISTFPPVFTYQIWRNSYTSSETPVPNRPGTIKHTLSYTQQ